MPPAQRALAARLGKNWRELALGGGEDYVLLFTLPETQPPPAGAVAIGKVTKKRGIWLRAGGRLEILPPLGFDHLAR